MIGQTIGHYRIEAQLGEGGMGVVYRARDLSLNRPVAIKFLSAQVADEEHRRRFQQEAQAASALNHPHIVAVYEAGTYEGRQYLVTEYVEGTTLREWGKTGPTARQTAEMLAGVADALACAHEAGIVHRDVKPENILVAKSGYAKLTDFGLARVGVGGRGSGTGEADLTRTAAILGTVPYMSPEQIGGRGADGRSDIFSLGVVLYEVLAGERPFTGKSDVDVLHAILHSPAPSLGERRADLPAELRMVVEKSLEKEPGERYQSMREVAVDLKRVQRVQTGRTVPIVAPVRRRGWAAIAGVVVGLVAALVAGAVWLRRPDSLRGNPLANARFSRLTDFAGDERHAAISPDGKFAIFVADRDGPFDIWLSQVGTGEFVNLTKGQVPDLAHELVRTMGFSGDGAQIWLHIPNAQHETDLGLMPTIGGPPRRFLENTVHAAWSPDGTKLVYHEMTPGDPMFVADRNGGNPRRIFVDKPGMHDHFLTWSPDGRWIYFVRGLVNPSEMDLWRIPSTGGEPERLTSYNRWMADPALVDDRTLLYVAVAEDGSGPWLYWMDVEERLPHRASLGVEYYTSIAAGGVGTRRLVATVTNPSGGLWTAPLSQGVAEESSVQRVPLPTMRAASPRFGPDFFVYLATREGADRLWKFQTGVARELWNAGEGGRNGIPALSADGRQICLTVRRKGRGVLYRMTADGTGARPLAEGLDVRGSVSWSPDGKWVVVAADEGQGSRVFKVPVEGGAPVRLTEELSSSPLWSPDGKWIVYSGPQVGQLLPLRGVTPEKAPVPLPSLHVTAGGERYRFLPDGKGLVVMLGPFRQANFWLLDPATGSRRQLTNLKPGYVARSFDISPDGRQILFDRVQEHSDVVLIELPERGR